MTHEGGQQQSQRDPRIAGGFYAGRIFGIPFYVSGSWFLVLGLFTWAFAPNVEQNIPAIGNAKYPIALTFSLLLFASVLVHELSHAVVARVLGLPVRRIVLTLIGGVSEIERDPKTPDGEFLVAIVGPLTSIIIGGGALAGYAHLPHGTVPRLLLGALGIANVFLAGFNLLPGLPLDGGRVLRALMWRVTHDKLRATRGAALIGRGVAVAVIVPGVFGTFSGGRSGADLIWGIVLGSFIWAGATQTLRLTTLQERVPSLNARKLVRRALSVPADLPLAEAIRRANDAGARGIVIVDSNGKPDGVVEEAAVVATPEQRRPWIPVSSLARRLTPGIVIDADLAGMALIEAMQRVPSSEYLVVERSGSIVGILAAADVARSVEQPA